MHQTASFLADHVIPNVPLRQWVLAPPFALVGLLGARHDILSQLNRIFIDAVFRWLRKDSGAGTGVDPVHCGAVTFIQRFSGSLLLFPHLHVVALDGVYRSCAGELPRFIPARAPSEHDVRAVAGRVALGMARLLERLGLLDSAADPGESTPLDRWYTAAHHEPAGLARIEANGAVQVDPSQHVARRGPRLFRPWSRPRPAR